jgi:hypothetical protein
VLTFEVDDVDALLDEVTYGTWQSQLCLQLIFGAQQWNSRPSVDHLHPRSAFSKRAGEQRGLTGEALASQQARRDLLPNLQAMHLLPNQEKSDRPLAEWLSDVFGEEDRAARVKEYLLESLPLGIEGFDEFFAGRRARMRERLVKVLCG